jgi:hypothetical protein
VHYARIFDHNLLRAVTYLTCFQAALTLDTMAAMSNGTPSRLLREVSQRNPGRLSTPPLFYLPCSPMPPTLTCPTPDLRLAGYIPTILINYKLNASVHADSSGIPVVVSSAGEAEPSSAFGNAKIAHDERTILRKSCLCRVVSVLVLFCLVGTPNPNPLPLSIVTMSVP